MPARKPKPKLVVPPGGFAGFNQQTQATQALFGNAVKPTRKKRRRTTRKKVTRKKRTTRKKATRRKRAAKPKRLVKGSAAAKRHMAKLRRMRRKK